MNLVELFVCFKLTLRGKSIHSLLAVSEVNLVPDIRCDLIVLSSSFGWIKLHYWRPGQLDASLFASSTIILDLDSKVNVFHAIHVEEIRLASWDIGGLNLELRHSTIYLGGGIKVGLKRVGML